MNAQKEKTEKTEATINQNREAYNEAVRFINARVESSKRSLLEIGEYLLERFFEGDIEAVKSKKPGKTLSLRELAKRDDINMSLTDLSRAVNLAAQEREIGTVPTSEQLSLSHKEILLRVQNLETKKEYMEIAVKEKLSVRQLEARLKKDGITSGSGSEEEPDDASKSKQRNLLKAFAFLSGFSPRTFKEMDADAAQKALPKAEMALKAMQKIVDTLLERVAKLSSNRRTPSTNASRSSLHHSSAISPQA